MSKDFLQDTPDLSSLIGSRICHDLISPIGAIGNGMELLMMSGIDAGPELSLITESVENANHRIRLYRIAFGMASAEQAVSKAEILCILRGLFGKGRLGVEWDVNAECRRHDVKAAFLGILCLESAMPYGGKINVSRSDNAWRVAGRADKMKLDPECWSVLEGAQIEACGPPHVHFPLLVDSLSRIDRTLTVTRSDGLVDLDF